MGSNPDPNPPSVVDDPENILRKQRPQSKEVEHGTPSLVRSTSLAAKLVSFQDLSFDIKFELSLFRSKSESSLLETFFDPSEFETYLSSPKSPSVEFDRKI